VQQRQPELSSTTPSDDDSISVWSRPISPNSLTITATLSRPGWVRRCFSNVVLPEPRKPVSTLTGRRSVVRISGASLMILVLG